MTVQIEVPVDFKLRQDTPAAPELVSYDVKPALLNAAEANQVLDVLYPPQLKESKIGGRTVLWVHVGLDGHVEQVRVMESSGYEEFDRAAGLTSRVMVFRPAQADGAAVAVWNQTTVTFLPDGGSTVRP
jgi:TonB family protein